MEEVEAMVTLQILTYSHHQVTLVKPTLKGKEEVKVPEDPLLIHLVSHLVGPNYAFGAETLPHLNKQTIP